MECCRKPQPFWIKPKVTKKQGHQPPIKLEISSFFGLEKLVFKLCPQDLPNATARSLPERIRAAQSLPERMGQNSLSNKECGRHTPYRKIEGTFFLGKLIVTLSANRRNLKALGIFCLTGLLMKGLFILVNFHQAGKRHENLIDRHEYFLQYRLIKT